MAQILVIFDPTDRVQVKPEFLPRDAAIAAVTLKGIPITDEEMEALARKLSKLLVEQIKE